MNLLIEILTEELPAIPFLKEEKQILPKWQNILQKHHLNANFEFYYTPRRIVLLSQNFPTKQEDQKVEFFGPPIEIAYQNGDLSQGLSKAGEGWLKKFQLTQAQTIQKDGKEVLYFSQEIAGKAVEQLLPEMIEEWLQSLHFGKSMRWGSLQESFIRPIRNIAVLLGNQEIPISLFGIKGGTWTLTHRDFGFAPQAFSSLQEYLEILERGGVILDPKMRRSIILKQIEDLQKQTKLSVEIDEDLLCEVVAITEAPRVLLGSFEKEFLALPSEVIITSMKENQRYFAVYQDQKLHHSFVVVINSHSKDTQEIIKGNEKVLRARLSDAMFFYRNDLQRNLIDYDLSKIAFVEGLGMMSDKVKREEQVACRLLQYNPQLCNEISKDKLQACMQISKSDLLSEMVGEFPELQGVMGEYYALAEGQRGIQMRDLQIAKSLKEQYYPNGEDAPLPSEAFSAMVALSSRIDTLMALFSIAKIPSGSKDPFALRRAGNGILRIVIKYQIRLDLSFLQSLQDLYQTFEIRKVWEFLLERLEGVLKINASILRSVIMGKETDLAKIIQKALALNAVFESSDKEALVSTFKRVANITKDFHTSNPVDSKLFEKDEEKVLYTQALEVVQKEYSHIQDYIQALFTLKAPLEKFFDEVMVNAQDPKIRDNRKALIYQIYQAFLEVGDIKEIAL